MDVSIKVMNLVWESSAGPAASRLVLLALADYADDSGKCWPSIGTLAKKCGISPRSVNRCLADLEKAGFLRREQRFNQSNVYVVTPDVLSPPDIQSPPDEMSPPDNVSPHPLTDCQDPPDNVGALTTNEPPEEPSKTHSFDEWWSAYPKKDGKLDAKKKYGKALKLVDAETLLAAAKAYRRLVEAENRDRKFILNPSTWLNQGHWEDENITPTTDGNVTDWLRGCWKRADTKAVEERSGLTYKPNGESPADDESITDFNRRMRQKWITQNHDEIIRRIMAREEIAA